MSGERDRSRRNAAERAAREKDVAIPWPEDLERRRRLEADDEAWLLWYFGEGCGVDDPFTRLFTEQQREMIAAIREAIRNGGDQAIAASRGEGKTTNAEREALKYTLQGVLTFSVLFAATGDAAADSLDSIKTAIETNERLAADYPEVCVPVRALENTPQRAHFMTATGKRLDDGSAYEREPIKFTWCGREVVLPNVPGAPAARAVIATRGLDSAVRGLKKKGKRPQLALIDDPDTEETARSEEQAKKLETRIDRAIGAMGGQQRRVARVMLTTLQSRISASYRFTDPDQKPWKGKRFRFLITPPLATDLWDEYVGLRRLDKKHGTSHANAFYDDHFEEMNAGAVVSNPHRHTPEERTALQFYYNEVERLGPEAVATEYDNDPPETTAPIESGISASMIQRQVSGLERGELPAGAFAVSHAIDVGKWLIHWVVRAWLADATGFTIDYGLDHVSGAQHGTDEGLDRAIRAALLARMEVFREQAAARGYPSGKTLSVIDCGYRTDAVKQTCLEIGQGCYPIMGFGDNCGRFRTSFSPAQKATPTCKPGDGWKLVRKGSWIIECDANRWKAWEHDRWMTARDLPGCMHLFGTASGDPRRLSEDERQHGKYAAHLVAEVEVEEVVKGVLKRSWNPKGGGENHWLDASYYSDVGANMLGVRLPDLRKKPTAPPPDSDERDGPGRRRMNFRR